MLLLPSSGAVHPHWRGGGACDLQFFRFPSTQMATESSKPRFLHATSTLPLALLRPAQPPLDLGYFTPPFHCTPPPFHLAFLSCFPPSLPLYPSVPPSLPFAATTRPTSSLILSDRRSPGRSATSDWQGSIFHHRLPSSSLSLSLPLSFRCWLHDSAFPGQGLM